MTWRSSCRSSRSAWSRARVAPAAGAAPRSTSTTPSARTPKGDAMDRRKFLLSTLAVAAAGCGDPRSHRNAVYMLVDTSGTYARESNKAQLIVNYLLGTLEPGDSLAVARVKSRSFSEKDIIAKATFDTRPSQANAQKRAFRDRIDASFQAVAGSRYTDIPRGLIQAAEFLHEGEIG